MRQLRGSAHGEPRDVLTVVDVPELPLAPGQVRVACEAVGLNFLDLMLCRGTYPDAAEPPYTPGVEVAGTVVEVTPAHRDLLGAAVLACPTLPAGALGDRVVVDAGLVTRRPERLSSVHAAALPVTYQTAWFALDRAAVRQGETLLVLAGAGGVGTAAIQLARARGMVVIAVAGGGAKAAICREQGATVALDHTRDDLVEGIAAATCGAGADVVIDPVGGCDLDRMLSCLAFEGRYVLLGTAGGEPPPLSPMRLLPANTSLIGLSWGSSYPWRAADRVAAAYGALFRLHERGAVRPLVSEVVTLAAAPAALEHLGRRETVGKLVVQLAPQRSTASAA